MAEKRGEVIVTNALSLSLFPLAFCLIIAEPTARSRILPDVANAAIVRSSHSCAAAIVADYLKLTDDKRSAVAIQGDIEAAIYSCQCQKSIHYWHIAPGLKTWAGANFKLIDTDEKCLRSKEPKERMAFEHVCKEIEAKRPFVVTISFDSSSTEGFHECLDSQQRISIVGIGYTKNPDAVLVLLPEGIDKEKYADQLSNVLSDLRDSDGDNAKPSKIKQLPWNSEVPNVVFTLVRP